MKKLLFIFLGLAGLNTYTAASTYDATKGALQNDPILCQYGYNPNFGSRTQYSGLNLNQDKATKPQTVQIVRQGEATPYWFKFNPLYQEQQPTEIIDVYVPSRYGAWALNPKTGISADTINAPSLEVAKKGAIEACEQGGA